jgi:hypothetical protein
MPILTYDMNVIKMIKEHKQDKKQHEEKSKNPTVEGKESVASTDLCNNI